VTEEVLVVGVGHGGQHRHQGLARGGQHQGLVARRALRKLALRQPLRGRCRVLRQTNSTPLC
jgi:hypothetical protein